MGWKLVGPLNGSSFHYGYGLVGLCFLTIVLFSFPFLYYYLEFYISYQFAHVCMASPRRAPYAPRRLEGGRKPRLALSP
jgi:hypothetical protein